MAIVSIPEKESAVYQATESTLEATYPPATGRVIVRVGGVLSTAKATVSSAE